MITSPSRTMHTSCQPSFGRSSIISTSPSTTRFSAPMTPCTRPPSTSALLSRPSTRLIRHSMRSLTRWQGPPRTCCRTTGTIRRRCVSYSRRSRLSRGCMRGLHSLNKRNACFSPSQKRRSLNMQDFVRRGCYSI